MDRRLWAAGTGRWGGAMKRRADADRAARGTGPESGRGAESHSPPANPSPLRWLIPPAASVVVGAGRSATAGLVTQSASSGRRQRAQLSSKRGRSVLRQTEPVASTRSAGMTRVRLMRARTWQDALPQLRLVRHDPMSPAPSPHSQMRRGRLRAQLVVTCTRDETPIVTSTSVQQLRDSDRNSSARAGDTNGPPARQYLRAVTVLREMIPSRRWRSG